MSVTMIKNINNLKIKMLQTLSQNVTFVWRARYQRSYEGHIPIPTRCSGPKIWEIKFQQIYRT